MIIQENYNDLLDLYLDKFGLQDINDQKVIITDFNRMIIKKTEMMPYWFVVELIKLGYDITDGNDELDETFQNE